MKYELNSEAERAAFADMIKTLTAQGVKFSVQRSPRDNSAYIQIAGALI